MELGKKHESLGSLATSPSTGEGESKTTYPGFSLTGEHATKFHEDCEPKVGDEYAATVRLRVTGLTDDSYGKDVRFDVVELDDIAEEGEEKEDEGSGSGSGEAEEPDEETKALGYKRKKTEKETPDISAKTLQD